MAKEFGCPFFESSAALRLNVDEMYSEVVRCIRRKELADHQQELRASGKKTTTPTSRGGGLLCCIKAS